MPEGHDAPPGAPAGQLTVVTLSLTTVSSDPLSSTISQILAFARLTIPVIQTFLFNALLGLPHSPAILGLPRIRILWSRRRSRVAGLQAENIY